MKYTYCEDGKIEVLPMRKVYRMFSTLVDETQIMQGTTFHSWLDEMCHMQILCEVHC